MRLFTFTDKANHSSLVPPQKDGNRSNHFQQKWYSTFLWLHFEPTLGKVLCFVCLTAKSKGLFSESIRVEDAFTKTGFGNWKKGNVCFQKHQLCSTHEEALKNLESYSKPSIATKLCSVTEKKQEVARTALKAIFSSIVFLAQQGLALRGSDNSSGNFMELLNLRARDIQDLTSFLRRPKSYTSGEVQNELLELTAHSLLRGIASKIQEAKLYSLIVDETSDCSVREQVSLSVRIVTQSLEVEEYFLGLYETSSTSGATLTTIVLDCLQRFGLRIEDLRGQCYDGASNMSGQFKGVQAQMLKLQPKAIFVHCLNHSLNLALQETISRHPYVNELGTIVTGSPKRKAMFEELMRKENDRLLKPRPLCPTRWTVREKSILGVLHGYNKLMALLEELAGANENVSTKASGLLHQMRPSFT